MRRVKTLFSLLVLALGISGCGGTYRIYTDHELKSFEQIMAGKDEPRIYELHHIKKQELYMSPKTRPYQLSHPGRPNEEDLIYDGLRGLKDNLPPGMFLREWLEWVYDVTDHYKDIGERIGEKVEALTTFDALNVDRFTENWADIQDIDLPRKQSKPKKSLEIKFITTPPDRFRLLDLIDEKYGVYFGLEIKF